MHPLISQDVAQEHRRDLLQAADRHRRSVAARQSRNHPTGSSLDTRLGWLLIGIGCHLVALRAKPADASAVRSI